MSRVSTTPPLLVASWVSKRRVRRPWVILARRALASSSSSGRARSMMRAGAPFGPKASASSAYIPASSPALWRSTALSPFSPPPLQTPPPPPHRLPQPVSFSPGLYIIFLCLADGLLCMGLGGQLRGQGPFLFQGQGAFGFQFGL